MFATLANDITLTFDKTLIFGNGLILINSQHAHKHLFYDSNFFLKSYDKGVRSKMLKVSSN